ncbi:MAG: helix-turn-helix domain-containing protein, partial [bacterium]|nr:helix-turn-helix domain-containing protein [bacterium]
GDALRIAAARIPGRLVALQDECVAMLLGPSEVTRAEAILPEIARHVRGSQPILAVGDVAERAQRYLDSLRSAQKVLRVARFLGLEASVMRSEDVGIYGLLFDEARSEELEAFRQRVLDKLLQSDNKGLLWETLECLWTQNFNLEATARSLGIHISTLRYRLDRIRAAAGLDWADPALRLQLEIAVVVERWRRTGAGAGAPQP